MNEYFSHMKDYDPARDNKVLKDAEAMLRNLEEDNKLIRERNRLEGSFPEHVCFPGQDFSKYPELQGIDNLYKNAVPSAWQDYRPGRPETMFRTKPDGSPWTWEEWNKKSSENAKKRVAVGLNIETGVPNLFTRRKFESHKNYFNGEEIFPSDEVRTVALKI